MHLIYSPYMIVVEICSGIAPASRAAALLGISCISFDSRQSQTEAASSVWNSHMVWLYKIVTK